VPERWNVKFVRIESPHGQRLAARACSQYFSRGPLVRGMSLALDSDPEGSKSYYHRPCFSAFVWRLGASSCWDYFFSGGAWQARGWGNRKSFHAEPLEYFCCGKKLGGRWWQSQ